MRRVFKAVPVLVRAYAGEAAEALGLPNKGLGNARLVIGRREWVALPELGISPINAKTDSGARSSSIHAEEVKLSEDKAAVSFVSVNHYNERILCEAPVAALRRVRSSIGVAKVRIFIETTAMTAGGLRWKILTSLANRSEMLCPMLLGRRALAGYFLIDPQGAHLLGPMRELERFSAIVNDLPGA